MQTEASARAPLQRTTDPAPPYPWALVLGAYTLVAAALTGVVTWSWQAVASTASSPAQTGPAWIDAWFQYDSGWYYHIATIGYQYFPGQQSSIAFFPVYPMTVRGLGALVGDHQLAGWVVAVLAGASSVVLFGRWAWDRLPRPAAILSIAVLMLYPYAFFLYGAIYADSTFLLAALGAFLLLDRRHYWAAGLVGALATAGRPVGVAVAAGLVVRMLELLAQDRAAAAGTTGPVQVGWRDLVRSVPTVRLREVGVLASGLGIAAWCAFLWWEFGNPLAFVEVESAPGWDQGVGPRTWFKLVYLGTLVHGSPQMAALLSAQALACLCAVLLLRRVWRTFGWGYVVYAAIVVGIPIIGTKDFMGTGRYVLVCFPVMAAAGQLLSEHRHRWWVPALAVVATTGLVLLTAFWGHSVEVS